MPWIWNGMPRDTLLFVCVIRQKIEQACERAYNSVIAENVYVTCIIFVIFVRELGFFFLAMPPRFFSLLFTYLLLAFVELSGAMEQLLEVKRLR